MTIPNAKGTKPIPEVPTTGDDGEGVTAEGDSGQKSKEKQSAGQ
jgi:hypothetical protein